MQEVKCKLVKGADGEFSVVYECEGFEATTCDEISAIMSTTGDVKQHQYTGDGAREIPIPVPNQQLS